jgi:hypothetical protein
MERTKDMWPTWAAIQVSWVLIRGNLELAYLLGPGIHRHLIQLPMVYHLYCVVRKVLGLRRLYLV